MHRGSISFQIVEAFQARDVVRLHEALARAMKMPRHCHARIVRAVAKAGVVFREEKYRVNLLGLDIEPMTPARAAYWLSMALFDTEHLPDIFLSVFLVRRGMSANDQQAFFDELKPDQD